MGTVLLSFLIKNTFFIISYTALIVLIVTDIYITGNNKKMFLVSIMLCILHLFLEYFSLWASDMRAYPIFHEFCSYMGYIVRPFILYFFTCLIFPERKHKILFIASWINLFMYATTHYTQWCVYYVDNFSFRRNPLGYVIFIICGCALGYITVASFLYNYDKHIRKWILPPISSILIIIGVYKDFIDANPEYPSNLNKALILVIFLFYLFYHLHLAEEYEDKMMQNQKLQLMLSQIKPHFFFNTITTIQALCYIDPKLASDTLGTFATYIRKNITTQTANLIPFTDEIQHVKTYVSIESLRFPNIEVQYDLQVTDFQIAALSIQPLVENAIRHGIRSRKQGIVVISTRETKDAITITIQDNGIGFDATKLATLDESHVGISNVRSRLRILQEANMSVNSDSEGTTIVITLPVKN